MWPKAADVQRIFAETKKAFGKLDVLVNNAGVYQFAPLEAVTEEDFHRLFNTNVLGLILATQEAAKHFGDEGGSVINIGSAVSRLTPPGSVVYTATKGAVDAVTGVLAQGTGTEEDSRELDQSGHGRDGRFAHGRGLRAANLRSRCCADSAWTHRAA